MGSMMQLQNRTAVVTGAASGIGQATAISLARRKCNLALADLNAEGLAATAKTAQAYGVRVSTHILDVSDPETVAAFPEIVKAEHGGVDILINNAGVAIGGTFEQLSDENFEWLFGINFRGVVRMTRAFLPLLKQSDDARLVNVSSIFGMVAPPGQSAYVASKFAVRGFSMALRHELGGTRVGVSVVHPGGVATSIAKSARHPDGMEAAEAARQTAAMNKMLRMAPEQAGEIIVSGIERRHARILVGRDAKVMALMERIAPISYWVPIGWILKKMMERSGRKR